MDAPASSPALGAAATDGSSRAPLLFTTPAASAASSATSVAAASHPFVFQTNVSSPASGSVAPGSTFAPLFSSTPPADPPPPRHPIFNDHITNHIKFLLNHADHNYHKWKSFFLMVLVRYGVTYLLDHPPPPNADAQYLELDAHVALWLYATLADSMVDHAVGATTSFAIWKKIQDYFLSNRVARFMILSHQYRNLKQGDLPVLKYARHMKLLTDGLADIDHPVSEIDITTQFLHGLEKRLNTIRVVLGDQALPFDVVLSRVTLAEESMTQRAAEEGASTFALHGGGSSASPNSAGGSRGQGDRSNDRGFDSSQTAPHAPSPAGRGDRNSDGADRGRGRGLGRGRGRGHAPAPAPTPAPFTGYFAPYGMALPAPHPVGYPPTLLVFSGLARDLTPMPTRSSTPCPRRPPRTTLRRSTTHHRRRHGITLPC
ncbi:hypothetical protein D1007_52408 [Hordeum vulgare]|nr:hypothetical protein D1007_52408 [Hordeum vulgare]